MGVEIKIGDVAKDRVTGFKGVVIGRTEWLNGCARLGLQSQSLKDGSPIDAVWFDENQLELVKRSVVKPVQKETGGPRPAPMRARDPQR